jgi:hypothetical protein
MVRYTGAEGRSGYQVLEGSMGSKEESWSRDRNVDTPVQKGPDQARSLLYPTSTNAVDTDRKAKGMIAKTKRNGEGDDGAKGDRFPFGRTHRDRYLNWRKQMSRLE